MADIRPELSFTLYRTILVGNLPDPEWAATLALPNNTASIRQSFPSNHAFAFTLILRDVNGDRVVPGTMTYTGKIYAMLNDGVVVSALEGDEILLAEPYQVIGSGSVAGLRSLISASPKARRARVIAPSCRASHTSCACSGVRARVT